MIPLRRVLVVLAVVASVLAWGGPGATPACADGSAGLVVRDRTGSTREACVGLRATTIDSIDLLRRAGYKVTTRDYGANLGEAVCSLNGSGSATSDCPSANGHWHLWRFIGDAWVEALEGASAIEISAGDIQGWVWQDTGANRPPPAPTDTARCLSGPGVTVRFAGREQPRSKPPGLAITAGVVVVMTAALVIAQRRRRGGT